MIYKFAFLNGNTYISAFDSTIKKTRHPRWLQHESSDVHDDTECVYRPTSDVNSVDIWMNGTPACGLT